MHRSVFVKISQTCYVTGPSREVGFGELDRVQVGRIRSIGHMICFLPRLSCFRTSVLVYKLGDIGIVIDAWPIRLACFFD